MDNNEKKPLPKPKPQKATPAQLDAGKKNISNSKGQSTRTKAAQKAREDIFVKSYLIDFNATKAAEAAGFKNPASRGNDLMKRPHIIKAIKDYKREMDENVIVTKQMITNELFKIAFSDYTDLIELIKQTDGKGNTIVVPQFKVTELIGKGMGKLIKSMKIGRRGVEVVIHSKEHALEMLAKHIGYFEADNDQKRTSSVQVYIPDNGRGDNQVQININNNGKAEG